jgi:hypothetical protein
MAVAPRAGAATATRIVAEEPERWQWNRLVTTATADVEVPEDVFPWMVAEIERRLAIVGHVSVMGGMLTWSPATQGEDARKLVVQVTVRGGRTTIRIQENLELQGIRKATIPAGIAICGAMGAAWTAAIGMGEPLAPLLTLAMAGLGGFLGVRLVIDADATQRRPQLLELARALAALAQSSVESPPPAPALPGSK